MTAFIGRRDFITLLGGAAAAFGRSRRVRSRPSVMRRIGVLMNTAADDTVFQIRLGAFLQGLALLGWSIGRNVQIDTRWATANGTEICRHAAELVALAPDVIAGPWRLDRGAVAAGDPHRADRLP